MTDPHNPLHLMNCMNRTVNHMLLDLMNTNAEAQQDHRVRPVYNALVQLSAELEAALSDEVEVPYDSSL